MTSNKPVISHSSKNYSADTLLSLFNKIPDYSEVKHLGQSDFIRALENLKEEFRRCRASLYRSGSGASSEEDFLVERTSRNLNIKESASPLRKVFNFSYKSGEESFLQVTGSQSQLHRNPSASAIGGGGGNNYAINYLNYNKPSRSLSFNFGEGKEGNFDTEDEDTQISESSKWSSSPDLGAFREFKDYVPPNNIQQRLLARKEHNKSAPSLSAAEDEKSLVFKAHPVPSHVYKPLYEFIMLKNQRRSQKVREQSKQKLLAQVKPFSFAREKSSSGGHFHNNVFTNPERAQSQSASSNYILNNAKPIKSRKGSTTHTNNFKMVNQFRAQPAPPRKRALLSAMRLKEQQEYRELKKRLRSEALLKNATLPPSMAARDKRIKLCNAKLDSIIQEYQNSCNSARDRTNNRNTFVRDRDQSTDVDDTLTDEDRLSEDSFRYLNSPATPNNTGTPASAKVKRQKNFTPFGKSRHSSAASGLFECTSNDNLASRLRIQATRKKEVERIKREEEELLKLLRNENRRKKLRDSHLAAWRRAHSYSSSQDISMRRQLRMAASILERESFVRDMSSMLSRVRSAPLLLEGVRERRFEPCKKHKEEFLQLGDRLVSSNKPNTPRFTAGNKTSNTTWLHNRYGYGADDEPSRSEAAMAEGSLTNSDNELDDNSDHSDHSTKSGKNAEKKQEMGGFHSERVTPTPTPRTRKKQLRINFDNEQEVTGNNDADEGADNQAKY